MKNQFGMFIHWGIYALTGWQEQYRLRLKFDKAEYAKLADKFNPVKYNPNEWVKLAKDAGMKYICFTTKHHDGFCMWDTKFCDFNIINTPYGKDVLKELAEACQQNDMELSLYYSIPDAWHPNAYNPLSSHQLQPEPTDVPDMVLYREYIRNQITELMTNYGKIYTLFWDIPPNIADPSLNEYVRSMQPDILINDRGFDPGDFSTPERNVPDGEAFSKMTEACQSVGKQSWGYRIDEDYYSTKFLMQSILKIMLMGGSYLLNVGPMADGTIPAKSAEIIGKVGKWYNNIKESVTGTAIVSDIFDSKDFYVTKRDNSVYLHFIKDLQAGGLTLAPMKTLPRNVTLLNKGSPLKFGIDLLPEDCRGGVIREPNLHIYNIPVDEFIGEVLVMKIDL
jgi:Alpha-L-fucosidase